MSDANEDEDEDEGEGEDDDTGEDEGENEDLEKTELPWSTQFMESEIFQSPIDLNIGRMIQKELTPLIWCNYDKFPAKLKITNTGKTVVLSAKWHKERPFITEGPFSSKQIFSQLHFHWGPNDMEGSEHSVDGQSFPMELHAVHFKSDYTSHEAAIRRPDGISILVHFFKLQSKDNPKMKRIIKHLESIKQAETSSRIVPWPMSHLLRTFYDDYFLYRGSISATNYRHNVTWLISRESIGISMDQVAEFRLLRNMKSKPIGDKKYKNRKLEKVGNEIVYHVNPSGSMCWSLLPISRGLLPARVNNCNDDLEQKHQNDGSIV